MDQGATPDPARAWAGFVDGLRAAGEQLDEQTADLDPAERADAYRALLRGLNNQLGRFEVDRERPELVPFNGWRQKVFMDNPDYRYWVADIRDDRRYRITGSIGDAAFLSVTAYSSSAGQGPARGSATARIDSDSITFDSAGRFELTVSRAAPDDGSDWLEVPDGATAVWVRQFHPDPRNDDGSTDERCWCTIEPIDQPGPTPPIDPVGFDRHLARLGSGIAMFPAIWSSSTDDDLAAPNTVRRWTEMTGGAAFTEPNVDYLRGSWELDEDEALVVEGVAPICRCWNVLLYSRFLNSLDHRTRRVSWTGDDAHLVDGRYRFVISAREPTAGGAAPGDWLDTEGRPFGLFVFRFLQPEHEPQLPTARRCRLDDLVGGRADAGDR